MNRPTTALRSNRLHGRTCRLRLVTLAAGLSLALPSVMAAPPTVATIDWLSYAPTQLTGSAPPAQNTFVYDTAINNSPYGKVMLTYSAVTPGMVTGALVPPTMQNGSIAGNAYSWGTVENFGRTGQNPSDPINQTWQLTYSFATPMQSNDSLVVGIGGLGRRTANFGEAPGDKATIVNVSSPGTFTLLGEYDNSAQFAPTQWTTSGNASAAASLTAMNSVSAPGGLNPNWNTQWAVYRYDALGTISALTFSVDQTNGDGIGVNIGFLNPVPEPQTYALMAIGLALVGLKLRRRSAVDGN